MTTISARPTTALVLGGGGSTGNAWLIGVVAGLADAGLDVIGADLTVGTSAGATAAAQLTGSSPADLYAASLVAPPRRPGPAGPVVDHLARLRAIIDASADLPDFRRRLGAAAIERAEGSDGDWSARWRSTVAARLPGAAWPDRVVRLTAVDARTGEPLVLDRRSGVDLIDAVAASCSSGTPYRLGDRVLLDGGYRRNENADLAAGHDRVLVLSPLGGRSLHPTSWRTALAVQVAELEAGGSSVEVVVPRPGDEHLFGADAMDLSLRPDAARCGHAQGQELAPRLTSWWG